MPEEIILTGQTSENTQVGTPEPDNQTSENATVEASFTGTEQQAAAGGTAKSSEEPVQKPMQSKEQNSEFARRRREAERRAELREVREKAILEALGGKNPYTGKEMKDGSDIAEFELMRDIKQRGGDPVADFAEYHKEKEREKIIEARKAEEDKKWFSNDLAEFQAKYPGVNLDELSADKKFNDYAEGKVGRKPLAQIYESYVSFIGESQKAAEARAAQAMANSAASPGALTGQSAPSGGFFTKEQVGGMSMEEVDKNYPQILKSMKKW